MFPFCGNHATTAQMLEMCSNLFRGPRAKPSNQIIDRRLPPDLAVRQPPQQTHLPKALVTIRLVLEMLDQPAYCARPDVAKVGDLSSRDQLARWTGVVIPAMNVAAIKRTHSVVLLPGFALDRHEDVRPVHHVRGQRIEGFVGRANKGALEQSSHQFVIL